MYGYIKYKTHTRATFHLIIFSILYWGTLPESLTPIIKWVTFCSPTDHARHSTRVFARQDQEEREDYGKKQDAEKEKKKSNERRI